MASNDQSVDVDMRDVARDMTLTINLRGVREFRFRMWIVMRLVWLIDMVSPVDIKLEGYSEVSLPKP